MRFKLDENLPVEATQLFRTAGHDASSVVDQRLQGAADSTLDVVCRDEGRILVTLDLDFGDIRGYPPAGSPGRVVLRVSSQEKKHVLAILQRVCTVLQRVCTVLEAESPTARLWIIEDDRIRVRE